VSGPELVTLGCRLNIAESETMRALASGCDDLVIVNSCAVTEEAVRETRRVIRRARRRRPDARIYVTGCAAEIDGAAFAAMAEVDRVIGNREKLAAGSYLTARPFVSSEVETRAQGVSTSLDTNGREGQYTRAFIPVQNGCDHACSFCIIPQGRGPSRSEPAGGVIDRLRAAVDAGAGEVVLTGVDLTSYGPDLPGAPTLGHLVERILTHVPALKRLRLSSLDSVEIDDRLLDLITGEPRVMPHLHLSLQHGDDLILKRMKRRHNRGQAIDLVRRIKALRPEIAIGADLIAGFPTESAAAHAGNLTLIEECDIVFGHIFPYSARHGTPAARMPQVDHATIKARAAELRAAADARRAAWLTSLAGSRQSMLVENDGLTGHAENFARVRLAALATARTILPIRITGVESDTLTGTPA
jgi:threonylcarbamoyladenosine tRNA methylthiotransferase MtaB